MSRVQIRLQPVSSDSICYESFIDASCCRLCRPGCQCCTTCHSYECKCCKRCNTFPCGCCVRCRVEICKCCPRCQHFPCICCPRCRSYPCQCCPRCRCYPCECPADAPKPQEVTRDRACIAHHTPCTMHHAPCTAHHPARKAMCKLSHLLCFHCCAARCQQRKRR